MTPAQIKKLKNSRSEKIDLLKRELAMKKQENSVIGRIGHFIEPVIRPLGFDWKMGVSLIAGGAAKEVVVSTMGVLYPPSSGKSGKEGLGQRLREQVYTSGPHKGQKVFTPLAALAFLLFILIYFPCIAVIAAIKNETGQWKWSLFLAVYTTTLAWIVAFVVFQGGSLLGF